MRVWDAFVRTSNDLPGRPALLTLRREPIRFHALRDASERLADELVRLGATGGELVALSMPNEPGFAAAFLALSKVGATVALVSPKFGRAEWEAIERAVPAMAILSRADAPFPTRFEAYDWSSVSAAPGVPPLRLGVPRDAPNSESSNEFEGVDVVKWTSGSTGFPKGIALTADQIQQEARNVIDTLEIIQGTRICVPVPLVHSYGFDLGFLPMVFAGATMVLDDLFVPRRTLEYLAGSEVDIFLGVPSIYHFFLEGAPSPPPRLSRIRHLLSCTAPLTETVVTRFHDRFGALICQHYGSSETGAVTNHIRAEVLKRPFSVGRPMSGVHVEIRNDDGSPLPSGSEGEVFVRSGAVARGYVAGAPRGEPPFRHGGFYMGDRGVLDRDGFLEIRGRCDDIIIVGGFKVSPLEVKRALESHVSIREAAVYGVPDKAGGEVVHALVTLRSKAEESEIIAYCRRILSEYKVPRRVEICEELPRGGTGKVKIPRERSPS